MTISLGTKFQLKLKILFFWTKFAQKGYFWSKIEKASITTELSIFKLVYNHFRNIFRLFDVLANFPFAKNETMRDYYL